MTWSDKGYPVPISYKWGSARQHEDDDDLVKYIFSKIIEKGYLWMGTDQLKISLEFLIVQAPLNFLIKRRDDK